MKKFFTVFAILILSAFSNVNSQINSFPYVQTGEFPVGWNVIQSTPIWNFGTASVNPAGKLNDAAVICNFFAYMPGPEGIVVSPAFNFTLLNNPVVHFYTAYTTYDLENDSVQFLVSTDVGNTFSDTPVPFRRSFNSVPSLATAPTTHSQFNPSAVNQWRHETVNLAAYAGMNNIAFGIRGVCYFGNNFWIDNFVVTDADNFSQQSVTAPGSYSFSFATVNFNSIGFNENIRLKNNSNNNSDNPSGGVISFTQHNNENPVPSLANPVISPNAAATTQDGSVFTPNKISPDSWFTVSYSGNDINGYANYNISLDLAGYSGVLNADKLYIVKRVDLTGSWVCLNSTRSGSILTAAGLTTFSDFAVAGDSLINPLPVELISFTSSVLNRNVTLNWSTASEINNSDFDIERIVSKNLNGKTGGLDANVWSNVGNVNGYGSANSVSNYSFTDRNLISGKYIYRIKQNDYNGNFEYFYLNSEVNINNPMSFMLSQNYPNPFNPVTTINYQIPSSDLNGENNFVSLTVFDINGKKAATLENEIQNAGFYSVNFNASALPSGIYFYKLVVSSPRARLAEQEAGLSNPISVYNFSETKKMMLLK